MRRATILIGNLFVTMMGHGSALVSAESALCDMT
jgi:hypothetical protein